MQDLAAQSRVFRRDRLAVWGVSKPAIPWRQTQWQDAEGEPPFEETRNLSSRQGGRRLEVSLLLVLVSGGGRRVGDLSTCTCTCRGTTQELSPCFGRRQFSGKRGRGPGQPGSLARRNCRREG